MSPSEAGETVSGRARRRSCGDGCRLHKRQGAVCAIRYNPDGSLDPAFGVGGQKRIDVTPVRDRRTHRVTLQADGKIVLAGESGSPRNPKFVVVRLDS